MIYRVLADFVMLAHFVWILFLIFGLILALMRSKMAFVHVGGLLFTLFLNIMGWYCPLTSVESYLHTLAGSASTHSESFITQYLYHLIYPDLPEEYIRVGDILFFCLYLTAYGYLAKRYRILDRIKG
jgi:hypothetical protein